MQNRTGLAGLSIGARARQAVRAHKLGLGYLGYIAAGFVSANAFVLGGLAPFGVAFAASAKQKFGAAAILGATLGYLFSLDVLGNVKYIVAMAFLFLLRWVLSSGSLLKGIRPSGQALTALALGPPSLAITFLSGGSVYDGVLAVAELLLACCAAYFFSRSAQALELGADNLRQTDVTSLVITFCIVILALVNLKVLGVSVGRTLAVLVILICAQAAREAGGAIAGVAAGVSAGVIGGPYTFLMGTYGFGGCWPGCSRRWGAPPRPGRSSSSTPSRCSPPAASSTAGCSSRYSWRASSRSSSPPPSSSGFPPARRGTGRCRGRPTRRC